MVFLNASIFCHTLYKYERFKILKKIGKFFSQDFNMVAIFKMAEKWVF
jgi:hypothetical protein